MRSNSRKARIRLRSARRPQAMCAAKSGCSSLRIRICGNSNLALPPVFNSLANLPAEVSLAFPALSAAICESESCGAKEIKPGTPKIEAMMPPIARLAEQIDGQRFARRDCRRQSGAREMRGPGVKTIAICEAIKEILDRIRPASVRAVCYRLFVRELIRDMTQERNR